jgi:hypothetical protein
MTFKKNFFFVADAGAKELECLCLAKFFGGLSDIFKQGKGHHKTWACGGGDMDKFELGR